MTTWCEQQRRRPDVHEGLDRLQAPWAFSPVTVTLDNTKGFVCPQVAPGLSSRPCLKTCLATCQSLSVPLDGGGAASVSWRRGDVLIVAALETLSMAAGRSILHITAWVLVLAAVLGVVAVVVVAVMDKRRKKRGRVNAGFRKVGQKAGQRPTPREVSPDPFLPCWPQTGGRKRLATSRVVGLCQGPAARTRSPKVRAAALRALDQAAPTLVEARHDASAYRTWNLKARALSMV